MTDALVAECIAPPHREIETDVDAFEWAADMVEAFLRCKAKHEALVEVIKESNYENK